jgi:hypothetical protein
MMNAREYELLTVRDNGNKFNGHKDISDSSGKRTSHDKTAGLRAIRRAPTLVQKLYTAGLINADLARLLGPDPDQPHAHERQRKAARALQRCHPSIKMWG